MPSDLDVHDTRPSNGLSGAAIDQLIADLYTTPPEAIAATKAAISEGVK